MDKEVIEKIREQLAFLQMYVWKIQQHIDATNEFLNAIARGHLRVDGLREIALSRLNSANEAVNNDAMYDLRK